MPLLRTLTAVSAGLAAAVALTACGGSEPLASGETEAIVIGSQDYYSNEIIAEIYAQALEAAGHEVVREFRIGQREVYVPEIESGAIDLFPETRVRCCSTGSRTPRPGLRTRSTPPSRTPPLRG